MGTEETVDTWESDLKASVEALERVSALGLAQADKRVGGDGHSLRKAADEMADAIRKSVNARLNGGAE